MSRFQTTMSCTARTNVLIILLLALLIVSGVCGVEPMTTTSTSTTPRTSTTTTSTTTPTTATTTPTTATTTPPPYTSTQLPTPTPKPPIPEKGVWMVFATEDSACIYLEMAASIEFYYINIRNEIDKGQINIPIQADVIGSCGAAGRHRQSIKLMWYFNSPFANSLEFVFRRNSHMYEIDRLVLNITLDSEDFPLARDTDESLVLLNKNIHFITPESRSYKCSRPHTFPLHHHGNNVDIGKLKIMHLRFQAFGDITSGHVARAMDCKSHQSSWLLLVLLGSIVILATVILVAYIISKKRHPVRGYLAMADRDKNQYSSEGIRFYLRAEGSTSSLLNPQSKDNEISVRMPYSFVKLLMKKFGRN